VRLKSSWIVANGTSEEIFDFSSEKMTTHKTTRLKNQFCQEFSEIFQLCTEVLEKAQIESLISATLETTLRFLSWVPLGYIFGTNIVALLHERVCFLMST
jgi:exportin-1